MSDDQDRFGERFSDLHGHFQDAMKAKDYLEAESVVEDIFSLAGDFCAENPTREFELNVVAGDCAENGDWVGAECAYKQILALPEKERLAGGYRELSSLAGLYSLLNRKADALLYASWAVVAARKQDLPVLKIMSLASQAGLLPKS